MLQKQACTRAKCSGNYTLDRSVDAASPIEATQCLWYKHKAVKGTMPTIPAHDIYIGNKGSGIVEKNLTIRLRRHFEDTAANHHELDDCSTLEGAAYSLDLLFASSCIRMRYTS